MYIGNAPLSNVLFSSACHIQYFNPSLVYVHLNARAPDLIVIYWLVLFVGCGVVFRNDIKILTIARAYFFTASKGQQYTVCVCMLLHIIHGSLSELEHTQKKIVFVPIAARVYYTFFVYMRFPFICSARQIFISFAG